MKVGRLIEKLQKFDKDATVRLHSINGEEVIFVTAYKDNNESIFLETASENDMGSEIDARLEDIKDCNEERSRYVDMWLDGINVEMVRKYAGEEAAERMEEIIKSYDEKRNRRINMWPCGSMESM